MNRPRSNIQIGKLLIFVCCVFVAEDEEKGLEEEGVGWKLVILLYD